MRDWVESIPSRWDYKGPFTVVNPHMCGRDVDFSASDMPVGSAIYRDFHGVRHWVHVVPPVPKNARGYWRYIYRGERYRTLTAIVRVIAPQIQNRSGNAFFNLRRRRR